MMSMQTLAAFLGWCTVFNIVILAIATIALMTMRGTMVKIHSSMFGLGEADLTRIYMQYLANYKIAVFVLNLVPYLAVRMTM